MLENVYKFFKEIFPLFLEKLQTDKQDNFLITYDNNVEKYIRNVKYFRSQKINCRGDNILYLGLQSWKKYLMNILNRIPKNQSDY